ncbi:hypothetical protein [Sphingomonas sp.]|uniref:hypothetical protein n=1 Tax=Sphingomonas sp. TaxID=28214 RepID=UPI002DD64500|nr:hypothetical protein [Sphingomonas sp.]
MKPAPVPIAEKLDGGDIAVERGYESWKRAKIEAALAQARDRDAMIPAEEVWRRLGFER